MQFTVLTTRIFSYITFFSNIIFIVYKNDLYGNYRKMA